MDWTEIAESLTEDAILDLVSQLQSITLKDGKKPFRVEQHRHGYIDICLSNSTSTATLRYRRGAGLQRNLLLEWGVVDANGDILSRHAAMDFIEKTSLEDLVRGEHVVGYLEIEDHGETGKVFGVFRK